MLPLPSASRCVIATSPSDCNQPDDLLACNIRQAFGVDRPGLWERNNEDAAGASVPQDDDPSITTTVNDTEACLDIDRAPPTFQDLVQRSTRFVTSVPAVEVLSKIEAIIADNQHPLETAKGLRIVQRVVVHWDDYRLEIFRGGMLICTVQIFLREEAVRTGSADLYCVEARRGHLDIFRHRRFFAALRERLCEEIKRDYSLQLLGTGIHSPPRIRRGRSSPLSKQSRDDKYF